MKFVSKLRTTLFGKTEKVNNANIKLRYAFTGASGYRYFYFPETQYHLNTARYLELFLPLQKEYLMKINHSDIETFIEECEKMNKVHQFQSAIQALKLRLNITLDPMIVYQMMAVVYLREDEENVMPSKDLIKEKSEDIQNTMRGDGGETDFFQDHNLSGFLKSLNLSGANLTLLSLHIDRQSELFERLLKEIRQRTQSESGMNLTIK
jgi:hypothetical protein